MKEAKFNTEVKNSIIGLGHWAHKIADLPQTMMSTTRFNPEKPCDILAFIYRRGVAIEGKMLRKYEAFGLRHLRPSQVKEMDAVIKSCNRAFIFLNIRKVRTPDSPTINRLIVFDWAVWREIFMTGESIKKAELERLPFIVGKKGGFDLEKFCDHIKNTKDFGSHPEDMKRG